MPMNAPALPFLAFLRVRTGEYKSVMVDARYLAGRRAVLLPRFAMVGELDDANAIGLEYGQANEIRGDLVIGTTEQLDRLRALFNSYLAEEANDFDACEFWESLILPLNAVIGSRASYSVELYHPHRAQIYSYSRRDYLASLARG
jgi:hypothetical protein